MSRSPHSLGVDHLELGSEHKASPAPEANERPCVLCFLPDSWPKVIVLQFLYIRGHSVPFPSHR